MKDGIGNACDIFSRSPSLTNWTGEICTECCPDQHNRKYFSPGLLRNTVCPLWTYSPLLFVVDEQRK